MRLGYIKNNLTEVEEFDVYVMPGFSAGVDVFRIAGLTVSRIEFDEFFYLEQHPFVDTLKDAYYESGGPFFCIFCGDESGGPMFEGVEGAHRSDSVFRLARSCWLLKEGELYNPLEFIRYQCRDHSMVRPTGTYGQLAYQIDPRYRLEEREIELLEGLYYALALFDFCRTSVPLDLAEKLFTQTYVPALSEPIDRFPLLLASLEALVGRNAGSLVDAAWLTPRQRELLTTFRSVRNGIAHGRGVGAEHKVETLREIVRCLLRESLRWTLEEPRAKSVVGNGLIKRLLEAPSVGPEHLASASVALPQGL